MVTSNGIKQGEVLSPIILSKLQRFIDDDA